MESNTLTTIYYFHSLQRIGGIESFLYYLAKKYHNTKDITFVYRVADESQLARLQQYVRCIQWDAKSTFKCKQLFCNFNTEIIDFVDAEEYYIVLHGDYKDMMARHQIHSVPQHPKAKYIGVSKLVCDTFYDVTGIRPELCYNPVFVEEQPKILHLISATRLSAEKGAKRMQILADAIRVPFVWYVFTNSAPTIDNPNVIYKQPTLDIHKWVKDADALVQLSDNEGFCLSVAESLMLGTPVIATDLPVLKEIGCNDSNSVLLPFDMRNLPLDEIENIWQKKDNFTYDPPQDGWDKLLINAKSDYKGATMIKVRALNTYEEKHMQDGVLRRIPKKGEEWMVTEDRLKILLGDNPYSIPFVEVVETYQKEENKEVNTEEKPKRTRKKKNAEE